MQDGEISGNVFAWYFPIHITTKQAKGVAHSRSIYNDGDGKVVDSKATLKYMKKPNVSVLGTRHLWRVPRTLTFTTKSQT